MFGQHRISYQYHDLSEWHLRSAAKEGTRVTDQNLQDCKALEPELITAARISLSVAFEASTNFAAWELPKQLQAFSTAFQLACPCGCRSKPLNRAWLQCARPTCLATCAQLRQAKRWQIAWAEGSWTYKSSQDVSATLQDRPVSALGSSERIVGHED